MPHSFANVLVHVIFGTKDRRPAILPEFRERLFGYMAGIARDAGAIPFIFNGTDDHAHGLIGLGTTLSAADLLRLVKANSSRWVHEEFPAQRGFAWQSGYA